MRKLFKGGNYSKAETIWGNTVFGNSNVNPCDSQLKCDFKSALTPFCKMFWHAISKNHQTKICLWDMAPNNLFAKRVPAKLKIPLYIFADSSIGISSFPIIKSQQSKNMKVSSENIKWKHNLSDKWKTRTNRMHSMIASSQPNNVPKCAE